MRKLISKIALFSAFGFLVILSACKQKDVLQGDALVNEFVAVNMDFWYYWRDKIPAGALDNKSLASENYFNSLLYTFDKQARPDGDRFSRFLTNA
ncbi:MAG: hypothetical protein ACK41O_13735 [Runella zeae]